MMMQQHQLQAATAVHQDLQTSPAAEEDAPPKQVAVAMERLAQAGRVIADIRIGADRVLEALFAAAQPHQSNKPLHLFRNEEASMRQHLQHLQTLGRQLEDSGVLNGSLRSRSNSWGLHMPLVCPDGAVVAYAWKRQLAGQAGASAVDRTRLALKAFTDQKRRFFPHLEDESSGQISGGESGISKKHCGSPASTIGLKDELKGDITLSDVLMQLEKEAPGIKISTYQRLDWLRRASSLSSLSTESSLDSLREDNLHSSNRPRSNSAGTVSGDQVAVIELMVPSVFRAIVSLHPAGSVDPDAVAFFSPDEGGSYMHARGFSVYQVYRHITEYAMKALQYFCSTDSDMALYLLLHWVFSYQNLFTKVCSKCGRLLTMDRQSALLLPPVHRPYRHSSLDKVSPAQSTLSTTNQSSNLNKVYHIGCSLEEA